MPPVPDRSGAVPRRWTLHGLNNGALFRLSVRLVGLFPRWLSCTIGDVGSWLAWRTMGTTRAALIDNLRAIFPTATPGALSKRARQTIRAYVRDAVDFMRAIDLPTADAIDLFDYDQADDEMFRRLLSKGRGVILLSGHYGNWELGGVAMSRVFRLPLAVVAMPEASEEVNQLRNEIRTRMGIETIEVRRALDTALQIRKKLADNKIIALLMDRQHGRDREAVTFLDRQAWFLRTPVQMAYLSGAPLVPCFIERRGRRFSIRPGTPIIVDPALPRDQALAVAAQQFATQLEVRVRAHPEYWYHFYRYWDAQRDAYDQLT